MGILLFVVAQLVTMLVSVKIKMDTYKNEYKKLGDKGYKINSEKVIQMIEDEKNSRVHDFVDAFLFVLPGINIISSTVQRVIETKKFTEKIEKFDALLPMTDEEIEKYQRLDSVAKKATFVSCYDTVIKAYNDIHIYFESNIDLLDKHIAQLYYEKLPAISYTLEEIKKLSNSIESSYQIGKADGLNTAIIGLPNKQFDIDNILVIKNDKIEKYDYETIDEKDAKNERFIVYPFGMDYNESETLQKCYQDILNDRDNARKNNANRFNRYSNDDKAFIRVKRK